MKIKNVINALIVGSILLILYVFVGHDFVRFYLGGKAELIETAERIHQLCNDNGECPTQMQGWQKRHNGSLSRDHMLYFVVPGEDRKPQAFRLVYSFFMPDDWFEVEGGADRPLISGWESR